MDMDSTLIQIEVIDEIAKLFNVEKEIQKITELAMLGKLDFKESLKKRVEKLKGFKISDFNKIDLPLTSGAEEFIKTLKKNNFKIALITGGFSYFAHKLQEKLSIDHVVCNEFEVSEERLTGKVKEPIIDGEAKKNALLNLVSHYQISIENTIALGDGANDIPMLKASGTGIAFNAKPKTKELAPCVLDIKDLSAVLLALGIS
jgi:phosphoserine phosphatase